MERRGLRYRFFDRLLESLRNSSGYTELFHRVFDLTDFYKLRRFMSVNIGDVYVPSVVSLDTLTLELPEVTQSSTTLQYIKWDWKNDGKYETSSISENDRGFGLTAPFGISTHGHYEKDGVFYYLYALDGKGVLSVDFNVVDDKPLLFVLAPIGTTRLNQNCLVITDEIKSEVFSSCYISFSGATSKHNKITDVFYSKEYSNYDNLSDQMCDVLPTRNGNSSVARFREECLNRGANDAWVMYRFNDDKKSTGATFHTAPNYLEMKKVYLDGDDQKSASVVTQDGIMLSPGDVWMSDYEFYYSFTLHIGTVESNDFVPWGVGDRKVKFQLDFYNNATPLGTSFHEFIVDYSQMGGNEVQYLTNLFSGFSESPYLFGIEVTNPTEGDSRYDVTFKALEHFNVRFEPLLNAVYTDGAGAPSISRYQSFYLFRGLRNFVIGEGSNFFTVKFYDEDGNEIDSRTLSPNIESGFTAQMFPTDLSPIGMNNADVTSVGSPARTYNDFAIFSNVSSYANWNKFSRMKVFSDYYTAYITKIDTDNPNIDETTLDSFVAQITETDSTYQSLAMIKETPVLSFKDFVVPVNQSAFTSSDAPTRFVADIERFYKGIRTQGNGLITFNDSFAKGFYANLISGDINGTSPTRKYCFPYQGRTGVTENYTDNPFQFYTKRSPIADFVFQNDGYFFGDYFRPARYKVQNFFKNATLGNVEPGSSFVWISKPDFTESTYTVTEYYMVGRYDSTSAYYKTLLYEETTGSTKRRYYYFSTTNFASDEYQKSVLDYVDNLNQVKWSSNDTYYFENAVSKDFYENCAASFQYLYNALKNNNPSSTTSPKASDFYGWLDMTFNLMYKVSSSDQPRFFSFSNNSSSPEISNDFSFSIYCYNSYLLSRIEGNQHIGYVGFYLYSLPNESMVANNKREVENPIFLGNSLVLSDNTLTFSPFVTNMKLYTIKRTSGRFAFRYVSLRFNEFQEDTNNNFKNFISDTTDRREFFYPVKISFTDTNTFADGTTSKIFILKVHTLATTLATRIFAFGSGCVYSSTDYRNLSLNFNDSTDSSNRLWPTGVRPLLFYNIDTSITPANPIGFLTACKDGVNSNSYPNLYVGADGILYNAKSNFSRGDCFFELIPYTPYDINNDFEDIATFTFDYTSNTTTVSTSGNVDEELYMNQKVPLSYFLFNTSRDALTPVIQNLLQNSSASAFTCEITTGNLYFDSQHSPLFLLRKDSIWDDNPSLVKKHLVDLVDLSVFSEDDDASFMTMGFDKNDNLSLDFETIQSLSKFKIVNNRNSTIDFNFLYKTQDTSQYPVTVEGVTKIKTETWYILTMFHTYRASNGVATEDLFGKLGTSNFNEVTGIVVADQPYRTQITLNGGVAVYEFCIPMVNGSTPYLSSVGNTWKDLDSYMTLQNAYDYQCPKFVYTAGSNEYYFSQSLPYLPLHPESGITPIYVSSGGVVNLFYNVSEKTPIIANDSTPHLSNTGVIPNNLVSIKPAPPLSWFRTTAYNLESPYTMDFGNFPNGTDPRTTVSTLARYNKIADVSEYMSFEDYNSLESQSQNYLKVHFWYDIPDSDPSYNPDKKAIPLGKRDPMNPEDDGLIYDSGDFLGNDGRPAISEGTDYGNISEDSLTIKRTHYQTWAPYIGVDPMNLGDLTKLSEDDTTRFRLNDFWSQRGTVTSFNGKEAFLTLTDSMGSDPDTLVLTEGARLAIKRCHSGYSWDSTKSLDSYVDFSSKIQKTVSSEGDLFGATNTSEAGNSVLTRNETVDFYRQFVPSRAKLGLEEGVDTDTSLNGGDASTSESDYFGGGGADL